MSTRHPKPPLSQEQIRDALESMRQHRLPFRSTLRGADVARVRGALGLTQPELGQLVGAHWVTVSKWERGLLDVNPYAEVLLLALQKVPAERGREVRGRLNARGFAPALLFVLSIAYPGDRP